jgi:hypothetical protein
VPRFYLIVAPAPHRSGARKMTSPFSRSAAVKHPRLRSAKIGPLEVCTLITFLKVFKYLAAVVVALSVPGFGLVAFSFLMFCDHGPFLLCFLRMALAGGIAIAQVVLLIKAWTLLKLRQRPHLSAGLMVLSILPVPIAIALYMRIPA